MAEETQPHLIFGPDKPRPEDIAKNKEGVPISPINPWSEQNFDDGMNKKVRLQSYRMRTPNNSIVFVSVPDYDETLVEERYRYDCHAYAMKCYQKYKYMVEAGSLWHVLHDPALATVIVENLKTKVGPGGKYISANGGDVRDSKDIQTTDDFRYTNFAHLAPRPEPGDMMVFWGSVQMPEDTGPWYIRGFHSCLLENLVFVDYPSKAEYDRDFLKDGSYLKLETTTAWTKNGSNGPKQSLLIDLDRDFPSYWLTGRGPVGIYRLKPLQ